ncbi:MAG: hypothetical protein SNI32_08780, partial [Rikenellaceae bacterium]
DKLGTYRLRILPIAPNKDGSHTRRSYEYPVRQLLMNLDKPNVDSTSTKNTAYVSVTRATDAGFSVDIIDTYRKLAVAEADHRGDEKLSQKIAGGSFGGGLRFNYGHAIYVIDLSERAKGLQLLTLSHAQFKDLDDKRFKLWQKKLSKTANYPCPISSVNFGYAIEIEKKKSGLKTEYVISIDNESDIESPTSDELTTLMNAPRIPEVVCRYTRYHFEATIEFLKQCDTKYGMSIMEDADMVEAISTLQSELPKEDTSSFSFDKRTKDSKDNSASTAGISIDDLFTRYDELHAKGLGDKTEEGQELRTLIRSFIEQERLDVRATRSTTNIQLLEAIDGILSSDSASNAEGESDIEQER